jgi:pimeloyl-ACP methyl ester carboxylesterase
MIPVSFSGCAGWLHPADGDRLVVMCAATGYEELSAHQSWRVLADLIAAAGLPVLRFDYLSVGDSLDGAGKCSQIETWTQSIRDAITWGRSKTKAKEIVLVGVRIGGALAAIVAEEHPEVTALVLLEPVINGKTYVREQRLAASMMANALRLPELAADPEAINLGGYILDKRSLEALAKIDLRRGSSLANREVLLLGGVASAQLRQTLEHQGRHVESGDFPGYSKIMTSPTTTVVPFDDWERVAAWLTRRPAGAAACHVEAGVLATSRFIERRVAFGEGASLRGVLCTPTGVSLGQNATLFVNAGGNHHTGWGRSTVHQARRLAAQGHASLRMDVAGVGDSVWFRQGVRRAIYNEDQLADVSEAVSYLRSQGLHRITVTGRCSGAWLAFHSALRDERIARIVLVNLQRFIWREGDDLEIAMQTTYRSTESYLEEIRDGSIFRRLLNGDVNWSRAGGALRSLLGFAIGKIRSIFDALLDRTNFASAETRQIRSWVQILAERKVRVLFVYSDSDAGRDTFASHFGLDGRHAAHCPDLEMKIIQNADHDLTPVAAQEEYFQHLSENINDNAHSRHARTA